MWQERTSIVYDNETAVKISFHWGIENRPLWRTLGELTPNMAIKWADRFSPTEAVAAEWALAAAFEKYLNIKIPERAQYLRCIFLENQRLTWCFTVLIELFKSVQHDVYLQYAYRLRELLLEGQEVFTGFRVLPHVFTLGGVDRDLTLGQSQKMTKLMERITSEWYDYFGHIEHDILFVNRLKGVLPLTQKQLEGVFWGGAIGQASNYNCDLRIFDANSVYRKTHLKHFTDTLEVDSFAAKIQATNSGDAYARFRSIVFQIKQSARVIQELLNAIPAGAIHSNIEPIQTKVKDMLPNGTPISASVEAPSGRMVATLSKEGVRIESSSMRAAKMLSPWLLGLDADDIVVALASLGFDFMQADLLPLKELET